MLACMGLAVVEVAFVEATWAAEVVGLAVVAAAFLVVAVDSAAVAVIEVVIAVVVLITYMGNTRGRTRHLPRAIAMALEVPQ